MSAIRSWRFCADSLRWHSKYLAHKRHSQISALTISTEVECIRVPQAIILLQGIHPTSGHIYQKPGTRMFRAGLFITAKMQKQHICPPSTEWTNTLWYIVHANCTVGNMNKLSYVHQYGGVSPILSKKIKRILIQWFRLLQVRMNKIHRCC